QEEQSANIGVERLVEVLFGNLPERAEFIDTGVGEQDIDAASLCFYDVVYSIDIGNVRCVGLDGGCIASDLGHGLVEFRLPAAGDEHLCAFLDKSLRGSKTNAGAATCN